MKYNFHTWRLEIEPDLTRAAYASLPELDPSCCDACKTFFNLVTSNLLPPTLTEFLRTAGADPVKPQEVFGAAESGFLNAWWLFVGSVIDGEWAGSGVNAYVELSPTAKCWITGIPNAAQPDVFAARPTCQLELVWQDDRQLGAT